MFTRSSRSRCKSDVEASLQTPVVTFVLPEPPICTLVAAEAAAPPHKKTVFDHLFQGRVRRQADTCQPSRTYLVDQGEGTKVTKADICFVVDESGSMVQEHNWLKDTIRQLNKELIDERINDIRYCLIGYGTKEHRLGKFLINEGDVDDFVDAIENLLKTGQDEDGYSAMYLVFNNDGNFTFRDDAAKVIVLVTDEDRDDLDDELSDNVNLNYTTMLRYFNDTDKKVYLNVVVNQYFKDMDRDRNTARDEYVLGMDYQYRSYLYDPNESAEYVRGNSGKAYPVSDGGHGTTLADYVNLAIATGGSAWDLKQLRDATDEQVKAFTDAFIDMKVGEIARSTETCVECVCPNNPDGSPNCHPNNTLSRENCVLETCAVDGNDVSVGQYHFRSWSPGTGGLSQSSAVEIIFVVDESGSMENDQSWFTHDFINRTNRFLRDNYQIGDSGINNKYGLLVFASYKREPEEHGFWLVESKDAEDFDLVELYHSGKIEDGYMAIEMAAEYLRREPQVSGVEKIIVLVTDEDRDNVPGSPNRTELFQYLAAASIRLDVVVSNSFETADGRKAVGVGPRLGNHPTFVLHHGDNPLPPGGKSVKDTGHGTTLSDYVELAWDLCGVAWDLQEVKRHSDSDANNFGRDFTRYFSKRINDIQCRVAEARSPSVCNWCLCQSGPNLFCRSTRDISEEECRAGSFDYHQIAGEGEPQPTLEPTTDFFFFIDGTPEPTEHQILADDPRGSLVSSDQISSDTEETDDASNPKDVDKSSKTSSDNSPHEGDRETDWDKACSKGAVKLFSSSTLNFNHDFFKRSKKHVVTFCFKTILPNGVLMWIEQRRPQHGNILIQVMNGSVQAKMDLGSGSKLLTHDLMVSDGKWHKVMFRRKGNSVELRLDGNNRVTTIAGEQQDDSVTFRANKKWSIGSADTKNKSDMAPPLTGCISNVRVNKRKIKLEKDAVDKSDVFPC